MHGGCGHVEEIRLRWRAEASQGHKGFFVPDQWVRAFPKAVGDIKLFQMRGLRWAYLHFGKIILAARRVDWETGKKEASAWQRYQKDYRSRFQYQMRCSNPSHVKLRGLDGREKETSKGQQSNYHGCHQLFVSPAHRPAVFPPNV